MLCSSGFEVYSRWVPLINKSVLLIMTTKTQTQTNCGYEGGQKKKTPVAWFPFFFRAAARGSDNGDGKVRTCKKTSWVGRFSLNFFRFSSKFHPRCFSFRARLGAVRPALMLTLEAARDPLHVVTSGFVPVCRISVSIRLDLFRSFLSVVSDMCWKFRFHSGFTPFRK